MKFKCVYFLQIQMRFIIARLVTIPNFLIFWLCKRSDKENSLLLFRTGTVSTPNNVMKSAKLFSLSLEFASPDELRRNDFLSVSRRRNESAKGLWLWRTQININSYLCQTSIFMVSRLIFVLIYCIFIIAALYLRSVAGAPLNPYHDT